MTGQDLQYYSRPIIAQSSLSRKTLTNRKKPKVPRGKTKCPIYAPVMLKQVTLPKKKVPG